MYNEILDSPEKEPQKLEKKQKKELSLKKFYHYNLFFFLGITSLWLLLIFVFDDKLMEFHKLIINPSKPEELPLLIFISFSIISAIIYPFIILFFYKGSSVLKKGISSMLPVSMDDPFFMLLYLVSIIPILPLGLSFICLIVELIFLLLSDIPSLFLTLTTLSCNILFGGIIIFKL